MSCCPGHIGRDDREADGAMFQACQGAEELVPFTHSYTFSVYVFSYGQGSSKCMKLGGT